MIPRILPVTGRTPGFLHKSAVVASGQTVGYGLALAASPILCRLYTPLDFGMMTVFVTLMSLLGTVATLRYDNAIPLPKDDATAELLAVLARRTVLITSVLLAVLAFFLCEQFDLTVFGSHEAPFSYLLVAAVAAFASAQIHGALLIRQGKFFELSRMRLCYSITCLAAQLIVPVFWISGPLGLLLGQVTGYMAESLSAPLSNRRSLAKLDVSAGVLRRVAMEYRSYPLFDVSSSLLRVLSANGQALVIAWAYGATAAGLLALAQRILVTPLSVLSYSVSRVYYSEAATLARDDPPALRDLFLSTVRRMTLLAGPPLALVCVLSPWSFQWVFGAEWQMAGVYCAFLCPLILLRIIAFVVAPTLDVIHRQGLRLVRELNIVLLIVIGVALAHWLKWSELTAVASTTALGCLGYAVSILLTWQALVDHLSHMTQPLEMRPRAVAA